jgi:hypothetical protein
MGTICRSELTRAYRGPYRLGVFFQLAERTAAWVGCSLNT